MTGIRNAEEHENLLKEKNLTLEKARDIDCAALRALPCKSKLCLQSLDYLQLKNKKKVSLTGLPLSPKVGSKIVDFVVAFMEDTSALHLDRCVHIVTGKVTL